MTTPEPVICHNCLGEVKVDIAEIRKSLGAIETAVALCGPCRDMVNRHELEIHGNGAEGIKAKVAAFASDKSDSKLSIKETVKLLGALGVLTAAVAAAIGAAAAAVLR